MDKDDNLSVLSEKIMKCTLLKDDDQFVKEAIMAIVEDRKKQESSEKQMFENKRIAEETVFEVENFRPQAQNLAATNIPQSQMKQMHIDIKNILLKFIFGKYEAKYENLFSVFGQLFRIVIECGYS